MGRGVVSGVDRERFWLLLDEGWSVVRASVEVGITPGTGGRWVKKAGLSRRPGCPRAGDPVGVVVPGGRLPSDVAREVGLFLRDERREIVLGLVRGGSTLAGAARRVGVNTRTVRQWVDAAGVARWTGADRAARAAAVHDEVVRERDRCRDEVVGLVRGGVTVAAAARTAGVGESATRQWVRQAGVRVARGVPQVVKDRFWMVWATGASVTVAAQAAGINPQTGQRWARNAGVARRPGRPGAGRCVVAVCDAGTGEDTPVVIDEDAPLGARLSVREREQIALCRAQGMGIRATARAVGRSASTVSRELARNTTTGQAYRVLDAEKAAQDRARRPRPSKLALDCPLRRYVTDGLEKKLSPEEISHRIRLDYPDDPEMRVCHETIYQALYVQARGGLKREVETALRHGRAYRQPRRKNTERRGRIPGMIPISERPGDAQDRAVPGHWEGDLIIGKDSASAVATLVERSTRVTMLGHLPHDHTATTVRDAIVPLLAGLPDEMRRTLTWDQGSEMACHFHVADQANLDVYFADPHSPWQRGTNENTNGLLRQYMPKGTDLSIHTPDDLTAIATQLNNRPRKVLGWLTPLEAWHLMLGHTVTIGGQPAHLPDTLLPLAQRCVDS